MKKNINLLKEKVKKIKSKKYMVMYGVSEKNKEDVNAIFEKYKMIFNKYGIELYLKTSLNHNHEGENIDVLD